MGRLTFALVGLFLSARLILAAEPPKVERTIAKEPAYQTDKPGYALLTFGPVAADRVWLVWDGPTLYVDRNGNGDLTEAGDKVAFEKPRPGWAVEQGHAFQVGELTVGGRTHKGLAVNVAPLEGFAGGTLGQRADVQAVLAKDQKAVTFSLQVDAELPGIHGGGIGGRLSFSAGPIDLNGVLQFSDRPADAPVINIGGPTVITFLGEWPEMRVGRGGEFYLVVGSPGEGPGTFAMLAYEGTIPKTVYPRAEITFQPAKPGEAPLKEIFELKERC
jgi:hypothetical protein